MRPPLPALSVIEGQVHQALLEDVGSGDLTAALLPPRAYSRAQLVVRESAILCGTAWFDEVFHQLDTRIHVDWEASDGDRVEAGQILAQVVGPTRALLTGERTALNFVQLLSGVSTLARRYADAVAGTRVRLLDTRKTLPGLRLAQKYAVVCGGCANHRLGLYDAILIKENHVQAAGGIRAALERAMELAPDLEIEVEVENLDELREALAAGAHRILLDNFDLDGMREAVAVTHGRARLEASGGVDLGRLRAIAETGVDDISVGGLTKDVRAVDLSLGVVASWEE